MHCKLLLAIAWNMADNRHARISGYPAQVAGGALLRNGRIIAERGACKQIFDRQEANGIHVNGNEGYQSYSLKALRQVSGCCTEKRSVREGNMGDETPTFASRLPAPVGVCDTKVRALLKRNSALER